MKIAVLHVYKLKVIKKIVWQTIKSNECNNAGNFDVSISEPLKTQQND